MILLKVQSLLIAMLLCGGGLLHIECLRLPMMVDLDLSRHEFGRCE